jgi:hypothetical protein
MCDSGKILSVSLAFRSAHSSLNDDDTLYHFPSHWPSDSSDANPTETKARKEIHGAHKRDAEIFDDFDTIDRIVCEYLLYRGFVKSYSVFCEEKEEDGKYEMQAEKILRDFLGHIWAGSYVRAEEVWGVFETRFCTNSQFSEANSLREILENEWKKYFVIVCLRRQAIPLLIAFLERNSFLAEKDEWRVWFSLPYLPTPHLNAHFSMYFSRSWEEQLLASLLGYFHVGMHGPHRKVPLLMNFSYDMRLHSYQANEISRLRKELLSVQMELEALKMKNSQRLLTDFSSDGLNESEKGEKDDGRKTGVNALEKEGEKDGEKEGEKGADSDQLLKRKLQTQTILNVEV